MDFTQYHLAYNAAAHFAAQEKYPDEGGLIGVITQSGTAGFEALCWALAELSTQGELIRRDMGFDRQEPIRQSQAALYLKPMEIMEARKAVMQAISDGLKTTTDENEEVDEVLAELQKKTAEK